MLSKYIIKGSLLLLAGAVSTGLLTSCQSDDFGEGQGALQLKMNVNSTLVRSNPDNLQELRDGCTIYLSSQKGLIYKFTGVDEVPAIIPLNSGHYVAEAWAGDSVSASFDKKFYRGYQPFDITAGTTEQVTLNCTIANVVAAVEPDASIAEVLSSYTVTVSHSRASLDFTSDMSSDVRGYFMMPDEDTSLSWKIEGVDLAGNPVQKEGVIENVQRAHEYVINMTHSGGDTEPFGGGLITVTIDDHCLVVEDVVTITGAPAITGVGFDLNNGLSGEPGKWERHSLYVQAFGGLTSLKVHADNAQAMGLPTSDFDFLAMDDAARAQMAAAGFSYEYSGEGSDCNARIFLEAAMLNALPEGQYPIELTAVDAQGKRRVRTLLIQVTNADVKLVETPWTEVYATKATLHGEVIKDGASNIGFRYRKHGDNAWTEVSATLQGSTFSAEISGLTPGATYEYQARSAAGINSSSMQLTTESIFSIPNAGFEDWAMNGKILYPSSSGQPDWWDSGNKGSSSMSVNVTQYDESVKHSGNRSAYLKSQFVGIMGIGKFAAGNIFAGQFKELDGLNGILEFGRPFNGSRPVKLAGYCYYKPATVEYQDDGAPLKKGDMDQGIIYVALTTGTTEIRTNPDNRNLFDANGNDVVAYGQIVFTEEYGSASEMRRFEITLTPGKLYNVQRASHVVLTASASRYGDYFVGGPSVMYLDDLEFVY